MAAENFKERLVEITCRGNMVYRGLISTVDEKNNALTLCAAHRNGKNLLNSTALVIKKEDIINLKFLSALSLEELQANTSKSHSSDSRTPRKNAGGESKENNDCFDLDECDVNEEFDFAGNLKLFDKDAESREFDQQEYSASPRGRNSRSTTSYRKTGTRRNPHLNAGSGLSRISFPDQSSSSHAPTPFQQVQPNNTCQIYRLPKEGYANFKYVFNRNSVEYAIPAVTPEFWWNIVENLQDFGFNVDRICESLGALCAPVLKSYILSLPRRCESIIILCGPHLVGSAGMAIARYLSFILSGINISCFYYSNNRKMKLETSELFLLEKSSKMSIVRDPKALENTYDIVIDALDCETFEYMQILDWHVEIQQWLSKFQVPTIALQPPAIPARGSTFVISFLFPLQWNLPVLLCNLFPSESFFKKCGIQKSVDSVPHGTFYSMTPLHLKTKYERFFDDWALNLP